VEFDYVLRALRRAWLVILIAVVIGLGLSAAYVRLTAAEYTARASVYVSTAGVLRADQLGSATTFAQQQARNFSLMANRQRVLDPVITRLRLSETPEQLSTSITSTVPANTSMILIEVTRPSPGDAAAVANAIGASLGETASDLLPPARRGAPALQLQIVQRAAPPVSPSSPQVLTATLLGLGVGLGAGVALVLLLAALRRPTARAEEQPAPGDSESTIIRVRPAT